MLPAAQRNAQQSRPATHIVGILGGLCLSSAGGAATATARGGGSQHSPRVPAARKDGSAAIFAPGRRDRSSPRLWRSRLGGGVLLGTRVIHRPTVTLGVYQRLYIRVYGRPLVLHTEKVDTVGINSTEACPSVTVRNKWLSCCRVEGAGQSSVNGAVSFFPHGVMSSLTRRKLRDCSCSEGRAGHAAGDATCNTITTLTVAGFRTCR